jgi:L-ascorbate metabolism protein UlaG (beta-lactamase superfamily)
LASIDKADLILVSHGHFDHVGEAAEIAKKIKARLVATFDLGANLATYGGFPKDQMGYDSLGNFGGTLSFFDDEVKITFCSCRSQLVSQQEGFGIGGR